MLFNIDFDALIVQLLPPYKRSEKLQAWLIASFKGLKTLHASFICYRNNTADTISITGQVLYLERGLNRYFGASTIYISDAPRFSIPCTYNTAETNQTPYVYNTAETATSLCVYNTDEYNYNIDFVVNVPSWLSSKENQIKAYINDYKLASKRYMIQYFTEINPY